MKIRSWHDLRHIVGWIIFSLNRKKCNGNVFSRKKLFINYKSDAY